MAITFSGITSLIAKAGHKCDIDKPNQSVDDIGQTIRTLISHKTNVTCWMQEKSSQVLNEQGKVFIETQVNFYFSSDPEIREGYIIIFNGDSFIFDGIENQGGLDQLFKVEVERKL